MADAMAPVLPVVGGTEGADLRRESFAGAPASPGAAERKPAAPVSEEADLPEVRQATDRLNNAASSLQINARFRVLDQLHQVVVEMYDAESGEVIREIPPRRFLEMYADMMRLVGLRLDRTA